MWRHGDDGVERELRRVGPVAQPVGGGGRAGLVVENDLAGALVLCSVAIACLFRAEGVATQSTRSTRMLRRSGPIWNIVEGLFARLDGEGRAFNGLVVEPQAEQVEQALALRAEVGAGPAGCGVGVVLGEGGVNKPGEQGVALVERQALERGLRLNLRPEALQNGVDEAAALAWIEAERDGVERGREEALLGEGAEAAGSLRLREWMRRPAGRARAGVGWVRRPRMLLIRQVQRLDRRERSRRRCGVRAPARSRPVP